MLMVGCWPLGVSERGACGFSKERSFTYCASTAIWGIAICGCCCGGCGPPFVVDMPISGQRANIVCLWLTQGTPGNNGGAPPDPAWAGRDANLSVVCRKWAAREEIRRD